MPIQKKDATMNSPATTRSRAATKASSAKEAIKNNTTKTKKSVASTETTNEKEAADVAKKGKEVAKAGPVKTKESAEVAKTTDQKKAADVTEKGKEVTKVVPVKTKESAEVEKATDKKKVADMTKKGKGIRKSDPAAIEEPADLNELADVPGPSDKKATKATKETIAAPKTANEVIERFRNYQNDVHCQAIEALRVYADIKEAKGSSMSPSEQAEFRKEFEDRIQKAVHLLKELNEFKEMTKDIADDDKVEHRASTLRAKDPTGPNYPRLVFEQPLFSRAKLLEKIRQAAAAATAPNDDDYDDDFAAKALRALLESALALVGANADQADAMIDAFIDPANAAATAAHDDPLSALASLKTFSGVPAFVPGSVLEQTHRAMGQELFGLFEELRWAQEGLPVALKEAGEEGKELLQKACKGRGKGKATRKPRGKKAAGAGADAGAGSLGPAPAVVATAAAGRGAGRRVGVARGGRGGRGGARGGATALAPLPPAHRHVGLSSRGAAVKAAWEKQSEREMELKKQGILARMKMAKQ